MSFGEIARRLGLSVADTERWLASVNELVTVSEGLTGTVDDAGIPYSYAAEVYRETNRRLLEAPDDPVSKAWLAWLVEIGERRVDDHVIDELECQFGGIPLTDTGDA